MDLAAIAEDSQQCCNNQEYYSEVIANVITPAYSCLLPTVFSASLLPSKSLSLPLRHRAQCNSTALPVGTANNLPANVEFNVSIEESDNRRTCCFPALDSGSDQSFSFVIAHYFHQTWVSFIDILVQIKF